MDALTTTEGIAALAAGGVALVALALAIVLAVKVRRLRSAQRAVLGESEQRDLVEHAARLERGFAELRDWVEDAAAGIETRMAAAETRIDGCVAYRSLVRYDAYGEMSGRQSSSVALLDAHRSGVVLSSILHRDSARVYVKQIVAVQEAETDRAVVPIENSLEGAVGATLDALAGEADCVRIAAEVVHPIHHCLVAPSALPLERIERVLSHPQATAQCARFLRERLPAAERVAATSTPEAGRTGRRSGEP